MSVPSDCFEPNSNTSGHGTVVSEDNRDFVSGLFGRFLIGGVVIGSSVGFFGGMCIFCTSLLINKHCHRFDSPWVEMETMA